MSTHNHRNPTDDSPSGQVTGGNPPAQPSTDTSSDTTLHNALGEALSDEWSDEGCAWSMRFEGAAGTSDPWCVTLERWMEYDVPHHADFVELTWQFWGGSPVEALTEALAWVRDIEAWRPCPECDGFGWWGRAPDRKPCDDCRQTGLAHPTLPDTPGAPRG